MTFSMTMGILQVLLTVLLHQIRVLKNGCLLAVTRENHRYVLLCKIVQDDQKIIAQHYIHKPEKHKNTASSKAGMESYYP